MLVYLYSTIKMMHGPINIRFNVGSFHISHRGLMNLLEECLIPVPKYQMLVGCLQQYPLLREHESQEDLVDSDVLLHKGQVHS